MSASVEDVMVMRGLTKGATSSSRKDLLFQHIISEGQRRSILKAYQVKSEINKTFPSPEKERIYSTQAPNPPVEQKFNHCRGARISVITTSSKLLLENDSSVPVKRCSPTSKSPTKYSAVHHKLSSQENFPSIFKKKFDREYNSIAGDYYHDPRKCIDMLKNRSHGELTIPGRAADFKSEVQWRMQLRNND